MFTKKEIWVITLMSIYIFSCSTQKKEEATQSQIIKDTTSTISKTTPVNPNSKIQTLGIDVSHFQGDVNWNEIKKAGITFVYDKATEGETYVDPKYARNKVGAHENNLAHGSYHFFESDDDPIKQAELFLSIIDHKAGDMPPVLDLEDGGIKGDVEVEEFSKDILSFLKTVESKLGVQPIIYTNHPFGNKYLTNPEFSKYDLWIAEYQVNQPQIPTIWKDKGWLIWQRTERGNVEGSIGNVDHDLLNPGKELPIKK